VEKWVGNGGVGKIIIERQDQKARTEMVENASVNIAMFTYPYYKL